MSSSAGRRVVVGLSHRSAPLGVREHLALSYEAWSAAAPDVPTVLLTTCNRVEVYAWATSRPARLVARLVRALARASGVPLDVLEPCLDVHVGREGLTHLMRVVAGLDSLVLGEEHIRGQVREAYRSARDCRALPSPLDGVFSRALEAGQRIRSTTMLGRHPSVATAAVHVAQRLSGLSSSDLAEHGALVLGAGVMAKSAAQSLQAQGARLTLVNRTPDHAAYVAQQLGDGIAIAPLEELSDLLAEAALLVAATASRLPVVSEAAVREAMARRGDRPLVIVDIAVPRDVEASVRDIPGVQLLDVDDLQRYCPADESARSAEMVRAVDLVAQEVEAIEQWLRIRAVGPAISELRGYAEQIRLFELDRSAARLKDLTPEERATVEAMTQSIVNKLLHGPTVTLREAASRPRAVRRSVVAIHEVLRLDHQRQRRRSS